MKEIVRIAYDNITHEEWSSVAVNEEIPDSLFAWQPPAGWTEWTLPDPDAGLLKPGSKAPDFEMASVDGKRIRLSDYQGSAVWLCFWRLGCPPCREETPFLQELHTKYGDQGIVVLGVNVSDQRQLTLDYLRELGVTFPNILDTSEAAQEVCHQVYGGGGVPLNYLIDRNGNVVDAGFYHLSARAKTALGQVGIDLE